MKLIITTLTMFFISFGASAMSVEELYKDCKPLQNNGFAFETLKRNQMEAALACTAYLNGLADRGYVNCRHLKALNKNKNILFDKKNLEVISSITANAKFSNNPLITSFINFAENNPQKWKFAPYNYASQFIGKMFPCKLDK